MNRRPGEEGKIATVNTHCRISLFLVPLFDIRIEPQNKEQGMSSMYCPETG
jgi:hypothetical protein